MSLGLPVVVTGPSGVGKTTLMELAIAEGKRTGEFSATRLVTMTTRAPRPGEVDGVDYHFVTRERFVDIKEVGGFLENEENYGAQYLYGSPLAALQTMRESHDVVFISLDPKGARTVRQRFGDEALVIALKAAPAVLERRIRKRFGDAQNIEARIAAIPADIALSVAEAHYVIASVEGQKTGTMHRALELIRHRRSLLAGT